jgi:hypothetical protein
MNRIFLHSEEIMTSPSSSREGIVTYANKAHVVNDTMTSDTNSITQSKEGFTAVLLHDKSLVKDAHVNVDEYEDYDASSKGESYETEVLASKLEQALGFNSAFGADDNNKNYTYTIDKYQTGMTVDRKDADEHLMSARIEALETIVSSLARTCQSIDDLIVTTPSVVPSDKERVYITADTDANNSDILRHSPRNNFVGQDDHSDRSSIAIDHSLSKISVTSRSTSSTGGAYGINHFISPELVSRHVGSTSIGGESILDMYNRRSKVGYIGRSRSSRMSTDHIHGYASKSSDDSYSDTRDSLVGGTSQRIMQSESYPHMHNNDRSSYDKCKNNISDMDSSSGLVRNDGICLLHGNGIRVDPDAKHSNHNSSLIHPESSGIMTYDTTQQFMDDKMVSYTTDNSRSKDRPTSLNSDVTTSSLHSTHSQNHHVHQSHHTDSPIVEKDGSIGNSSHIGISDEMKDHIIDATGHLDVTAVNRRIAVMEEQFSRLLDSLEQSYHGHGAPLVAAADTSHIITTNVSNTNHNEHTVLSDSKSILSFNRTNIYDYSVDNGSQQQLEYSRVSSNNLPLQTNSMSDDNKSDGYEHSTISRTEQCIMPTIEAVHEISKNHVQQRRGERPDSKARALDASITEQGREKESNFLHAMEEKTRAASTQVSDNRSSHSSLCRDVNEGSDSLLLRQILMKIESTIHDTLTKLSTTGNISDMRVRDKVLNNGLTTGGAHEVPANMKQSERYPSSNDNLNPTYVAPLSKACNVSSSKLKDTVTAAVDENSAQGSNREYKSQDSSRSLTTSGDRMDMMNSRFSQSVSFLEQFALQNRIIEDRINQLPRPSSDIIINRSRRSYESIDRNELRLSSDRSNSGSMIRPESRSNTNYIHSSRIEPFNNRYLTTADASLISARQSLISPALQASSSLINSLSNNLLPRIIDNYQKSEDARFHSARINADSEGITMKMSKVQSNIPSSNELNYKQNHCGERKQKRYLTHPHLLTTANSIHPTGAPFQTNPIPTSQAPILTNQAPILTNQAPILTNQAPILTNQAPILTNQAPILTNQAPILTNQAPIVSNYQAPILTNQAPILTNQAPILTNQAPILTNQAPILTNQAPILTNQAPILTNQAPIVSNYQAPILTNQAPILTNQAPIQTNQAPILTNQAPILTNQAPILTNQAPILTKPSLIHYKGPIPTVQASIQSMPFPTYEAPQNFSSILSNQELMQTSASRSHQALKCIPPVTQAPIQPITIPTIAEPIQFDLIPTNEALEIHDRIFPANPVQYQSSVSLSNQAHSFIPTVQAPIQSNHIPINQAPILMNQAQIKSITISNDHFPIHPSSVSLQVSNPSMGDVMSHRNNNQS